MIRPATSAAQLYNKKLTPTRHNTYNVVGTSHYILAFRPAAFFFFRPADILNIIYSHYLYT